MHENLVWICCEVFSGYVYVDSGEVLPVTFDRKPHILSKKRKLCAKSQFDLNHEILMTRHTQYKKHLDTKIKMERSKRWNKS